MTGPRQPNARQRLAFLDAARGLAATYVIATHVASMPDPQLAGPEPLRRFALFGAGGVVLFFVVSAFSLCYTMDARLREPRPTLSFYVHRLMRIAPLFFALLAVTYLARYLQGDGIAAGPGELLASLTFTFNLAPAWQHGIVMASWTIGVEMVFYLIFPLVHRVLHTLPRAVAAAAAGVLLWDVVDALLGRYAAPETADAMAAYSVLKHLPVFFLGMALFFGYRRLAELHGARRRCWGAVSIAGGLAGLAAVGAGWLPGGGGIDEWYLMAVFYSILLIGLALTPWRVLVNAGTGYLGKFSYSIYLLHPLVISTIKPAFPQVYAVVPTDALAFLACLVVTFGLTMAAAAVTYTWIEKPGIRATRPIVARLSRGRAAVGATQRATNAPAV